MCYPLGAALHNRTACSLILSENWVGSTLKVVNISWHVLAMFILICNELQGGSVTTVADGHRAAIGEAPHLCRFSALGRDWLPIWPLYLLCNT